MKVFHVSWNDPETVFHEILWKKNFTVYPSLYKPYTKGENKGNCPLNIKHLSNCSFELFTLTEASAGGTFLYIANHLWYKRRNDLNIYKKNELESTFIELVNPKRSNIVVGVNYWHRPMDLTAFNCNYLNNFFEDISKEQKSFYVLGDFNVNLLN